MGVTKHRSDGSNLGGGAGHTLPPELTHTPGKHTLTEKLPSVRRLVASPRTVRFPATEVGAVSPAHVTTLTNRGDTPLSVGAPQIVPYGAEPARDGEMGVVGAGARSLQPRETVSVELVFRPSRVAAHIGACMRLSSSDGSAHVDVHLRGDAVEPRAEHAEQRELSVAEHEARSLAISGTPDVQHYSGMLAAVLAARTLSQRAADPDAQAQVRSLLAPVEARLCELNDHQGRLARFGAGNVAGQAALDMAQTAVVAWRQRVALGTVIRVDELVIRFRAGAEVIRFLTGEQQDASTLRAFNHASTLVGIGAAAPVLAPALAALAIEEAALLAFVGRVAARRVALWALSNPAAALAATEALIGFGVQIGEDGWEPFWDQLRDPQARRFVIAQILMDFLHVKSSTHSPTPRARSAPGGEPGVDIEGARGQLTNARNVLRRIADGVSAAPAEVRPPGGAASDDGPKSGRPYPDNPHAHVTQRNPTWCGAASGEMAARRLDVEIDQADLAASRHFTPDIVAGGQDLRPGGFHSEGLIDALQELAPVPGRTWRGGDLGKPFDTAEQVRTHVQGFLRATGTSMILRVKLGRHWIIVDEALPNGRFIIRDPGERTSSIVTARELKAMEPNGEGVLSYPEKKR